MHCSFATADSFVVEIFRLTIVLLMSQVSQKVALTLLCKGQQYGQC